MHTIRLIPSICDGATGSYITVTNLENMFNNTDNNTYASFLKVPSIAIQNSAIQVRGFNFDDLPDDIVVQSFEIKIKARRVNGIDGTDTYSPKLGRGSTNFWNSTCPPITETLQVVTFTDPGETFDTIRRYGDNFRIRIYIRKTSASSTEEAYLHIYGIEILVNYTEKPKVGENNISKIYKGEDKLSTVYLGDYKLI